MQERKLRVRGRVNVNFLGEDKRVEVESKEVKGGREIEWL